MNHENLSLMEQINQIEKKEKDKMVNLNFSTSKIVQNESYDDKITNNMMNNSLNKSMNFKPLITKMSVEDPNSINIVELIEENETLREQYNKIQYLKSQISQTKKENELLSKTTTEMNSEIFHLSKLFTEGIHEISKELLKIHEIQLDKLISNKNLII